MKKIISLLVYSTLLFSSSTIKVSQKQQDDLGIKMQEVTIIKNISYGPYSGTVKIDKKDVLSIGTNVESVVKNIYVKKFDLVKKGEKLLALSSSELLNLQKEYIESLIEAQNINENYARNIKLESEGIISLKKLLISKKEKLSSDLRVKLSKNHLLSNGLSYSSLKRLEKTQIPITKVIIYSSRDGMINDISVNVGQVVDSAKSMMSIYGDGDRFIELSIPVKKIDNISLGDRAEFLDYSAKISTIGRIVNSSAQSVQVRASIDNSKDIMINRIYSVNIFKKIENAVKVKKTALVFNNGISYVFKKVENGFEAVNVSIIKEGPVCYIVEAELNANDKVAASATSALLSAMESEDE